MFVKLECKLFTFFVKYIEVFYKMKHTVLAVSKIQQVFSDHCTYVYENLPIVQLALCISTLQEFYLFFIKYY